MSDGDQLVEFIRDRLDEREALTLAIQNQIGPGQNGSMILTGEFGALIYRWIDLDGALAAVEAKRRMLALHAQGHECPSEVTDPYPNMAGWYECDCPTIMAMATEWSTHEVYLANREKWKP